MKKKIILSLLSLTVTVSGFSNETQDKSCQRRGQAAGYASRDSTTLSMMGWGIGIFVGIAVICALIQNHNAKTTTTTN